MRYTREQACLAWLAQGMLGSRRLKKLLDEYRMKVEKWKKELE